MGARITLSRGAIIWYKDQGYRFSHLSGTVFENTNKPLRQWFRVIHMMLTSKKGMSALQIHRTMGFGSYETALHMTHRIRAALVDKEFNKLMGIVEVDETYVGSKNRNRHWDKRGPGTGGGRGSGKVPVVGAVSRKGKVVARIIDNIRKDTLTRFVQEAVSRKVSLICTDGLPSYVDLYKMFPDHEAIDHEHGQYVVGAIHTNTIEGFWSILKRGIFGTFHKVSAKYLPLYVAEFCSGTTTARTTTSSARRSGDADNSTHRPPTFCDASGTRAALAGADPRRNADIRTVRPTSSRPD
jgi:ISXO2-like transposase domain